MTAQVCPTWGVQVPRVLTGDLQVPVAECVGPDTRPVITHDSPTLLSCLQIETSRGCLRMLWAYLHEEGSSLPLSLVINVSKAQESPMPLRARRPDRPLPLLPRRFPSGSLPTF